MIETIRITAKKHMLFIAEFRLTSTAENNLPAVKIEETLSALLPIRLQVSEHNQHSANFSEALTFCISLLTRLRYGSVRQICLCLSPSYFSINYFSFRSSSEQNLQGH